VAKRPARQSQPKTGKVSEHLEVPATEINQGEHSFYSFVMKASQLWPMVSIARRSEDEGTGYQRVLSTARVAAMAKHISAGNPVPNSILVAFDKGVKFDEKTGNLSIPKGKDRAWVIDGQHRLAGAHEASKSVDIELNVLAFVDVDVEFQVEQFVTVNREAKGVPTSLVYDLLAHLPQLKNATEVAQERANEIATTLRLEKDSPFFNRIVIMSSPKSGRQISNTNFVRKVAPLVHPERGSLRTFTLQEQIQIIDNYFSGLKATFKSEWEKSDNIFFQTIGFGAAMNVFEEIFTKTLSRRGGFTKADVVNTLAGVKHFDFRQWSSHGSGNKAEIAAAQELRVDLNRSLEREEGKRIKL
jgi:DGQHR domain-containing protein